MWGWVIKGVPRWRPFSWLMRITGVGLLAGCILLFMDYRLYKRIRYPVLGNTELSSGKWVPFEQCPKVMKGRANIDTVKTYHELEFEPKWLKRKHFWSKHFEKRYISLRKSRPLLKVFVVPHSHNDPGWLETFHEYYEWKTKFILRNIVEKLEQYPNMTFVWNEISFLELWWNKAHPAKQKTLKKLISQGRLEITTGGWVMPDEACTHIYSLLDQYIEGHEWIKTNLGITPKIGWSIDPFGHGPTVPYLLYQSGLEGTIIQRIHYAWKEWMAERQIRDFYWVQNWVTNTPALLVHNLPFDIYSIKDTCGPHLKTCANFDFRRGIEIEDIIPEEITDLNVFNKSKQLVEQYHRIGSLTAHNVILVPLGEDFRYETPLEFDTQYRNYTKLFNFINSHKNIFHAHVQFGTPTDYFNAIKERVPKFPTLNGDFFVYADAFTSGKPAYWSGYYTTRPYFKIIVRQLEHQLRTAEILFTFTLNSQKNCDKTILFKLLEKSYENLISARRNLGLVQHHDAITGTSTEQVMEDYGTILLNSFNHCIRIQELALSVSMIRNSEIYTLQSDLDFDIYGESLKKQLLHVPTFGYVKIVVFNPQAEERIEVIDLIIDTFNVVVYDNLRDKNENHQITPIIGTYNKNDEQVISDSEHKLIFVAKLPALTAITYTLSRSETYPPISEIACSNCIDKSKRIKITPTPRGNIILENPYLRLLIDRQTSFLSKVKVKSSDTEYDVKIQFGAYKSAILESGAYLFKPNPKIPEIRVLNKYLNYSSLVNNIIIFNGPITTEIIVFYLPFLVHKLKIFNVDSDALSSAIYIENDVDFGDLPKNRETELFMRMDTPIENLYPKVEFYTDLNGFQYQRRVKNDKLGVEGNYYPISTMAWIQDNEARMTYITDHAQGVSSFVPGRLEVMLDRRIIYDDERGLGEGVYDNKPTTFRSWLKFENHLHTKQYQLPSRNALYLSRSLNYPMNVYFVDTENKVKEVAPYFRFVENFPADLHLMNLRTVSDSNLSHVPSDSCYMILQRPAYDCNVDANTNRYKTSRFTLDSTFNNIKITKIDSVSLTGLQKYSELSSLEEVHLKPMELKTYRLKFFREHKCTK